MGTKPVDSSRELRKIVADRASEVLKKILNRTHQTCDPKVIDNVVAKNVCQYLSDAKIKEIKYNALDYYMDSLSVSYDSYTKENYQAVLSAQVDKMIGNIMLDLNRCNMPDRPVVKPAPSSLFLFVFVILVCYTIYIGNVQHAEDEFSFMIEGSPDFNLKSEGSQS